MPKQLSDYCEVRRSAGGGGEERRRRGRPRGNPRPLTRVERRERNAELERERRDAMADAFHLLRTALGHDHTVTRADTLSAARDFIARERGPSAAALRRQNQCLQDQIAILEARLGVSPEEDDEQSEIEACSSPLLVKSEPEQWPSSQVHPSHLDGQTVPNSPQALAFQYSPATAEFYEDEQPLYQEPTECETSKQSAENDQSEMVLQSLPNYEDTQTSMQLFDDQPTPELRYKQEFEDENSEPEKQPCEDYPAFPSPGDGSRFYCSSQINPSRPHNPFVFYEGRRDTGGYYEQAKAYYTIKNEISEPHTSFIPFGEPTPPLFEDLIEEQNI